MPPRLAHQGPRQRGILADPWPGAARRKVARTSYVLATAATPALSPAWWPERCDCAFTSNHDVYLSTGFGEEGAIHANGMRGKPSPDVSPDASLLAWAEAASDAGRIGRFLNLDLNFHIVSEAFEAQASRPREVRTVLDPDYHKDLLLDIGMRPGKSIPPVVGHPIVVGCVLHTPPMDYSNWSRASWGTIAWTLDRRLQMDLSHFDCDHR